VRTVAGSGASAGAAAKQQIDQGESTMATGEQQGMRQRAIDERDGLADQSDRP